MSINSEMKKYELQKLIEQRSKTGARVLVWNKIKDINATIQVKNEFNAINSVEYQNSTHIGFINLIGIKKKTYRLYCSTNKEIFEILSVIPKHRRSELLLKRVKVNG